MQTYNRLSLGFNSHNIAYLLSVWAAAQSLQGISIRRSTPRSLNSAPSPSLARRLARQFLLGRVHLCSQAFEALSYPVVLEHRRSLCIVLSLSCSQWVGHSFAVEIRYVLKCASPNDILKRPSSSVAVNWRTRYPYPVPKLLHHFRLNRRRR